MLHENYHVFLENKFKVIFILTHNIEKSKSTHQDVISFFLKTNYKLIFECEHPIVGSDSLLIYTTDKNLIMLYDEN